MPRHKYEKNKRLVDIEGIVAAVKEVMVEKKAVRPVAVAHKVNRLTLTRYISKLKQANVEPSTATTEELFNLVSSLSDKSGGKTIFCAQQEKKLIEYILKGSGSFNGLSIRELRKLAYRFAKEIGDQYPASWDINCEASKDWYYAFKHRHKNLFLKTSDQIHTNNDLQMKSAPGAKLRLKFVDPELSFLSTEYNREEIAIPHNSDSKTNNQIRSDDTSDEESDSDYFGDRIEPVDPSNDTLDDDMSQQMPQHSKKRKFDDRLAGENSVGNPTAAAGEINGSRKSAKDHGSSIESKQREFFLDADEKWWQAQYALYLKLTKAQKFEMKKTISDLQLKFEYQNIHNIEPEMIFEIRQHSAGDSDINDDPLDVKSLW